jgi:hypothetical protein
VRRSFSGNNFVCYSDHTADGERCSNRAAPHSPHLKCAKHWSQIILQVSLWRLLVSYSSCWNESVLQYVMFCKIWGSQGGASVDVVVSCDAFCIVGRYRRFGEIYCLHFRGWRWRQYVSPKRSYLPTRPKMEMSQNPLTTYHGHIITHIHKYYLFKVPKSVNSKLSPANQATKQYMRN